MLALRTVLGTSRRARPRGANCFSIAPIKAPASTSSTPVASSSWRS